MSANLSTSTEPDTIDLHPFLAAGFAVQGLRPFASPDGGGYNATLTHNGVAVADLHDGGYGGEVDVQYKGLSWNGEPHLNPTATPAQAKKSRAQAEASKAAKDALDALIAATPPVAAWGKMLTVNLSWVVGELVTHAEIVKICTKKTLFRPIGHRGDLVINVPFDASIKAHILKKYPGARIYNEEVAGALPHP